MSEIYHAEHHIHHPTIKSSDGYSCLRNGVDLEVKKKQPYIHLNNFTFILLRCTENNWKLKQLIFNDTHEWIILKYNIITLILRSTHWKPEYVTV